jgi:hypothetical protein
LGLVSGLAFLAKYTGILLVGVTLAYVVASPMARRWLRRPSFYLGGVTALIAALPVIVWNYQHNWPSLTLHFVERKAPPDLATLLHNAFQVTVGQLPAYHPLLVPGLFAALFLAMRRSRQDDRYRFLSLASWPVLLFLYVTMVRVVDSESHWTMVGFVPPIIVAGAWLDDVIDRLPWGLTWYFRFSVALSAAAILGMYVYSQTYLMPRFVPASSYDANKDFFNEMTGWDEVKDAIEEAAGELGSNSVIAASQYALCAHILGVLDDRPEVYCPNPRRTEFDFLGRRDPPPGVPVVYVNNDHYGDDPAQLLPRRNCLPFKTVAVERGGRMLQRYHLFSCPAESSAPVTER